MDTSWNLHTLDISDYADGNVIRIRFNLESDWSMTYSGWNIDDMKVEGILTDNDLYASYLLNNITTGKDSYTLNVSGYSSAENFSVTADGVYIGDLTYNTSINSLLEDDFEDGNINGWTTGGDANWFVTTTESHNGSRSAASGNIGNNRATWIRRDITGPVDVSFYWNVSSEENYDFLRFRVNGSDVYTISGEVDWEMRTYSLPAGTHTVEWRYTKDGSVYEGNDEGYIDDIKVEEILLNNVVLTKDITAVAGDGSVNIVFEDTQSGDGTKDTLSIDQIEIKGTKLFNYSVTLTDPADQTTSQGENSTYTIYITNTGNTQDDFNLAITNTDNADVASISSNLVTLGSGNNTSITLTVSDSSTGTYNVSVTATSVGDPAANATIEIMTTVISDTTDPVINSVTLNTTDVYIGDPILVTVNTTDDIQITNVTAEGIDLTYQSGDTWEGIITAASGINIPVDVIAYDIGGNNATDSSQTYNGTDGILPSAITDLASSTGINPGEINLTWTAPGDDGTSGTASGYIVRYSTSQLTNQTEFDLATNYSNSWTPQVAGSNESYALTGLTPNVTYYFAIEAFDEVPNQANISNSPSAISQMNLTLLPNRIDISADPVNISVGGSSCVITAYVLNDSLSPITGASVTFQTDLGYFNESSTTSVTRITNASGYANATLISSNTAGNATVVSKTYRGYIEISNSTTVLFDLSGLGSISLIADPTSVTVNETSLITANVTDAFGNGVNGATVNFTVTLGNGSLNVSQAITNTSGYATTTLRTDTKAGVNTVTAETSTLTNSVNVTGVAGPPEYIWLDAVPPSVPADGDVNSTSRVTSTVFDIFYNPVSGANVTYLVKGYNYSFLTNSTGKSVIGLTPSTKIEVVRINASVTSTLNNSTTVSFEGGDPYSLSLKSQPSYIAVQGLPGVTNETMLIATVTDDWNRPLEGWQVNFTTTNGTLDNSTALTDRYGEATVTLASSYTPESVTVNATVNSSISSQAIVRFTDQPFLNINTTINPNELTVTPSYVNVTHTITGEGVVVTKPVDVVLALDNSGSMSGSDAIDLRDAAISFVNNLTDDSRCAIYAFIGGGNPSPSRFQDFYQMNVMYPDINPATGSPTGSNADGRTVTIHMIEWITSDCDDATPIWDTIGESINYAITNNETDHIPVVVALTDGDDTIYAIPGPTNEGASDTYCPGSEVGGSSATTTWGTALGNEWGEFADYGWITRYYSQIGNYSYLDKGGEKRYGLLNAPLPVYTIGLGVSSHQEEPYLSWYPFSTEYDLRQIATTSNPGGINGSYYYAPNGSELDEIYTTINEEIQRIAARVYANVLIPGTTINGSIVHNATYVNNSTTILFTPLGGSTVNISSEPTITTSGNNQVITFQINEAINIGDVLNITYNLYVNGTGTIIGSSNVTGGDGTVLGTFGPETVTNIGGSGGMINLPPVPDAGGPYQLILNTGLTVSFNGSGSYDPDGYYPLTYFWNFGDGNTGTGMTPSNVYPDTTAVYLVEMWVTDSLSLKNFTSDLTTVTAVANPSNVILSSNQSNIYIQGAPGVKSALITANVTYGGVPVRDGTVVTFTTTLGVFETTGTATATSVTNNGEATVVLQSAFNAGDAVIIATEPFGGAGSITVGIKSYGQITLE
ncbi:MAG: invasin domain 3-containing protein [Halobacteriota archaeon]|nr:invasin domain 3-containing protein [Halobacteriota archaeon]